MDDYAAAAEARLQGAGFRLTRSRRQVIGTLATADRALSPYGILDRLKAEGAVPDVVTVYRVLDLLETLELAHRVHSVNGYVACCRLRHSGCHHPIICTGCGRIQEIEGHHVEPLQGAGEASGWQVTGHVLEFQGLCPDCR